MRNLFIVIVLVCFAVLGVSAQKKKRVEAPVQVFAPGITQAQGNTFTVPLKIRNDYAGNIISYQFIMLFDPSVVRPAGANFGCSAAGTLSAGMSVVCNESPTGTLRVAVYGAYGFTGSGNLLNLTFSAVGNPGSSSELRFKWPFVHEGYPASQWWNGYVIVQ